jgi:hypothetical protein
MHDHEIPSFILWTIILGYSVIAVQFSKLLSTSKNERGRKALLYLIGIFILCSFCGYASHFIPSSYKWIIIGGHIILSILTWLYILTHQVEVVINIFRD